MIGNRKDIKVENDNQISFVIQNGIFLFIIDLDSDSDLDWL